MDKKQVNWSRPFYILLHAIMLSISITLVGLICLVVIFLGAFIVKLFINAPEAVECVRTLLELIPKG